MNKIIQKKAQGEIIDRNISTFCCNFASKKKKATWKRS
jgi:hypothetical protein